MKFLVILFAVLLSVSCAGAAQGGQNDPYAQKIKTCSGDDAYTGAQNYFFGFKWENGDCAVMPFYANSYGEAEGCARRFCPSCEIEDITFMSQESRQVYELGPATPGIESYCPAKK